MGIWSVWRYGVYGHQGGLNGSRCMGIRASYTWIWIRDQALCFRGRISKVLFVIFPIL